MHFAFLFHLQDFNCIEIPHSKVACHQLIAVNSAAPCFFSEVNEKTVAQCPPSEIFLPKTSTQGGGKKYTFSESSPQS